MEDRFKYNLLNDVDKLTMPVLLVVWSNDTSTPPEHQELLYNNLPWKKEFHIIDWAPHTFKDKKELDEIYNIFDVWIKNSLNFR